MWPWLIDLYQAVVLFNEGRLFEARRLCSAAARFFDTSFLPGKAVLCHLLLARICLRTGELPAARSECARALDRLASLRGSHTSISGGVSDGPGAAVFRRVISRAYDSCQRAREALETLRSSLRGEELKIAFLKNRLEVYECLVELCLRRRGSEISRRIFRLHGVGEVSQSGGTSRATRQRAPGRRHWPERAGAPNPGNARGAQLVLPPHRDRAVARR